MNLKALIIMLITINLSKSDNEWHNLKVYFDYTHLINGVREAGANTRQLRFLVDNILVILKDYIFVTFFVREEPQIIINGTDRYDLLIFIESINDSNGYFASATSTEYDENTRRPNKGIIRINLHNLFALNGSRLRYTTYFYSMIHELFHVMGYTNYGVNSLGDKVEFSSEKNNYVIKSDKVLEYARKHYGCDTIDSLYFENSSRTSHWEDVQLGNDIIVAQGKRDRRISDITLAFFEDLGWYKVNHNMGQILTFGLDKGCEFISNPSKKFEEFSDKQESTCSEDFRSIAYYRKGPFSNNLFISTNYLTCGIFSDTHTRCFEYELNGRRRNTCAQTKCMKEDDKVVIEYKYHTYTLVCKNDFEKVSSKNFTINCPKISKFCDYRLECKNDCNGKGFCFNGTCICRKNFAGVACEFLNRSYINSYDPAKKCNFNGTFINNKCECFENYDGEKCDNMIVNAGSFGSNCQNNKYIKCYTGEYFNYLNRSKTTNHNYLNYDNSNNNSVSEQEDPEVQNNSEN